MDATKLLRTFCDAVEQRNGKVFAEQGNRVKRFVTKG